jgi:hypothetical protein
MACIKREILTNARPGDAASGEHIPRPKDAGHCSKGPSILSCAYSHSAAVTSYGKRNGGNYPLELVLTGSDLPHRKIGLAAAAINYSSPSKSRYNLARASLLMASAVLFGQGLPYI